MDSSFTVKPRDSAARTAVGRSNIVRTELSPSQSVNAAQQAFASHDTPGSLTRDPSLDPQCQSVLDREREERERRRARKDEIMLRQKAYGRTAEKSDAPADDDTPHADIQV
jgi:hypothetical protein